MSDKILCLCQYGHSRSVALAREFHGRNIAAVAMGVGTAGPWLDAACEAATAICLLDDALIGAIAERHRHKVTSFHVGADRWVNPYHPELAAILRPMVSRFMEDRLRA